MTTTELNKDEILDLLSNVRDPEIPVVTISEMGMLREVNIIDDKIEVVITPTYSGCPAMNMIKEGIEKKLRSADINNYEIKTRYSPAWTTEWMTKGTHDKLREYGIAPPEGNNEILDIFDDMFGSRKISCPRCGNQNTHQKSKFGSTPCKSLHYCNDCEEPFEHFKCH